MGSDLSKSVKKDQEQWQVLHHHQVQSRHLSHHGRDSSCGTNANILYPSLDNIEVGEHSIEARPPHLEEPKHQPTYSKHSDEVNMRSFLPSAPELETIQPLSNNQRPAKVRSRPVYRHRDNQIVKCVTCNGDFGGDIFQCFNGHSSCLNCKSRAAKCGLCRQTITEMKNFALQEHFETFGMSESLPSNTITKCPNNGCLLKPKMSDMEVHKKECPFQEIECPLNAIPSLGQCPWKGNLSKVMAHFNICHESHQADVDREMSIPNICYEGRYLYLIKMGRFNFMLHVSVDRKVSMTVQFLGTQHSASKWKYELHVFNKREPRRKYEYGGVCHSFGTPVTDIFNESDCAVLPLPYATTFANNGSLMYKFYIKKDISTHS